MTKPNIPSTAGSSAAPAAGGSPTPSAVGLVDMLGKLPVREPMQWMTRNVARNPLIMALINSFGGYMGGRHLAAPAVSWFLDEKKKDAERRAKNFGIVGGLGGLVPSALATWGRMSKTKPDPTNEFERLPAGEGLFDALTRRFGDMPKEGSEKRAIFEVPIQPGTSNLVLTDPYLQPYEKALVLRSIQKARDEQAVGPLVTVGDLTRGASQAGFGYLGARLLGSVLGLGFGMSPKNQKRMGLAGAVANVLTSIGAR